LYFNFDFFSRIGTQNSSVAPGNTVDSKIIISPFLIYFDTTLLADSKGVRSGLLNLSIGVGTVII